MKKKKKSLVGWVSPINITRSMVMWALNMENTKKKVALQQENPLQAPIKIRITIEEV